MANQAPALFDLSSGIQPVFSQPVVPPEALAPQDHFWTSSHWSPDGLSLAAVDNNRHVHTWLLPQDAFTRSAEAFEPGCAAASCESAGGAAAACGEPATLPASTSSLYEAEFVDAFAWHPSSCVSNPAWCVFATSCKEQPVHLWDALTGKVRNVACTPFRRLDTHLA